MSGDKYLITDQHQTYFITCTVVNWIDLFTRPAYQDICIDSLNYCINFKGLRLNGWVLMTNHLHLLGRCEEPHGMSDFLRDFKKHTSKALIKAISNYPESRKEWLLDKFAFEARRTQRTVRYKLWKDDNHAIDMSCIPMLEKLNYIHENPVRAGIVYKIEEYRLSSASDYAGTKGLVELEMI